MFLSLSRDPGRAARDKMVIILGNGASYSEWNILASQSVRYVESSSHGLCVF